MEIHIPPSVPHTHQEISKCFSETVEDRLSAWKKRLIQQPGAFQDIESEIHKTMLRFEYYLITALLSETAVQDSVKCHGEILRKEAGLRQGNQVHLLVRFLCGLTLGITCLYAALIKTPMKGRPRSQGSRGDEGAGLYPELSVLGIHEGVSNALRSEISRQAVLLPSLDLAQKELGRKDVHLDIKTILRIARETGKFALAQRFNWVMSWRSGTLPAGSELAGKKVGVAIDGGRIRFREFAPQGRRTKKNRRKFKTPWHEPRLFIIFVLDEKGRMDPNYKPFIDGTMNGPDALMELLAMHLHRMGATKAQTGVFLADGIEWIWNRLPWVMKQAALETSAWHFSVDFFHVMEHVSGALTAAFDGDSPAIKSQRKRMKRLLKNGHVLKVIQFLKENSSKAPKVINGHISYLQLRIPLMKYDVMKKKGLPIGSGAIESAIRRVINQRLKAPGTFWRVENAELFMYQRAQILTDRWEEMMGYVQNIAARDRKKIIDFVPTPTYLKTIPNPLFSMNPEVELNAA